MNEYQRFIQDELDRRNWRPADVEKHGGPTRQVMSNILNDKRKVLVQRPKQETIEGLATAFRVPVETVLAHVARAMGFPVTIAEANLDDVSDDDLLDQIRKRMIRESSEHETDKTPEQSDPPSLRSVSQDYHAEDPELEQKTPPMPDPELLAAHPDLPLQADQDDEFFDGLGEESQDASDTH